MNFPKIVEFRRREKLEACCNVEPRKEERREKVRVEESLHGMDSYKLIFDMYSNSSSNCFPFAVVLSTSAGKQYVDATTSAVYSTIVLISHYIQIYENYIYEINLTK